MIPTLKNIDHVHLYVSDRAEAKDWYQRVLGFTPVEALLFWATDKGPMTLQNAEASIHLALFEADTHPSSNIAFGADAKGFLDWKKHLESHSLEPSIEDHQLAWSLYFSDPFGNRHEITTYDYETVAKEIQQQE